MNNVTLLKQNEIAMVIGGTGSSCDHIDTIIAAISILVGTGCVSMFYYKIIPSIKDTHKRISMAILAGLGIATINIYTMYLINTIIPSIPSLFKNQEK